MLVVAEVMDGPELFLNNCSSRILGSFAQKAFEAEVRVQKTRGRKTLDQRNYKDWVMRDHVWQCSESFLLILEVGREKNNDFRYVRKQTLQMFVTESIHVDEIFLREQR